MTQRLPSSLTPLDVALRLLLDSTGSVEPIDVSIDEAAGRIAAATLLEAPYPPFNVAVSDGWAFRARDIVGASSYSPVPLSVSPVWVEAGDRLPDECDCVLDADMVEQFGPMFQVLAATVPGHGIRRAGDDIGAGRSVVASGQRINAAGVLAARVAGFNRIRIRAPRVCVIEVPSADGKMASSRFVQDFVIAAGARAVHVAAKGRDAAHISAAVGAEACDLVVTVGGTGLGRTDATIEALVVRGANLVHGLALQPGRTAAAGKLGPIPVIAVPGAPEQAVAVCLMLVQPALDLLMARAARQGILRPLARKISSSIGVAELVLLEMSDDAWMPIAAGQFSLEAIARGDAWLAIPGDSEGFAAGTLVRAFSLRDGM